MKTHHSTVLVRTALMIGALALAFAACKKSPETIGNGLISDENYIGTYHTNNLGLVCHSYIDSIGTKNVSNALLGSMNDPIFGLTQAGFCTQFRFSAAGQRFGNNPTVDSIVLQLYLSGYYGDTTTWQTVHVYELADTLNSDTSYYNYSEVAINYLDYANGYLFRPRPRTKRHIIGTDTITQPILRIPLSHSLGDLLMGLDSTAYRDPQVFKQHFHGLCLKCDPAVGNGSVSYLNLTNNSLTVLQLYYHNSDNPDKTQRYDYYITSADTYFNQINHDYTQGDPDLINQVLESDTTLGQQRLYLQAMGGLKTKITLSDISQWTDTLTAGRQIVINEAKLIVPAAMVDTMVFTEPSTLTLVGFNADGSTSILSDYYEGTSYFGGSYNSNSHSGFFRISKYLQGLILGEIKPYGLSLGISGGGFNAFRLVVNGPEMETNNLRVEVTYSLVNE